MPKTGLIAIFLLFSQVLSAQLPDGSIAPDFTATDINGQSWNLYELLEDGKTVILEISATWCPPCWAYHNSHAMQEFYEEHGPGGDDQAMVLFVEGDPSTNLNCLYGNNGCNDFSPGNWVSGTSHPIINDHTISNLYDISYFPTIYAICPNKKTYELPQLDAIGLEEAIGECPVAQGDHNAGIFQYDKGLPFQEICAEQLMAPSFKLVNLGAQPLSQAEIELRWNNDLIETIQWQGYLSTYEEAEVQFDGIVVNEPGILKTSIIQINNGQPDDDLSNNNKTDQMIASAEFNSEKIILKLKTDGFGAETYWELRDELGNVVDHGGNQNVGPDGGGQFPGGIQNGPGAYPNHIIIKDTLELPAGGCYSFHMVDAYGDGMCCNYGYGYYRLFNVGNPVNPVMAGGEFGRYDEHAFYVDGPIVDAAELEQPEFKCKVFPNPALGQAFVKFILPDQDQVGIQVFDLLGRNVYSAQPAMFSPGENQVTLPSENWKSGNYTILLSTSTSRQTLLLQVVE